MKHPKNLINVHQLFLFLRIHILSANHNMSSPKRIFMFLLAWLSCKRTTSERELRERKLKQSTEIQQLLTHKAISLFNYCWSDVWQASDNPYNTNAKVILVTISNYSFDL